MCEVPPTEGIEILIIGIVITSLLTYFLIKKQTKNWKIIILDIILLIITLNFYIFSRMMFKC